RGGGGGGAAAIGGRRTRLGTVTARRCRVGRGCRAARAQRDQTGDGQTGQGGDAGHRGDLVPALVRGALLVLGARQLLRSGGERLTFVDQSVDADSLTAQQVGDRGERLWAPFGRSPRVVLGGEIGRASCRDSA